MFSLCMIYIAVVAWQSNCEKCSNKSQLIKNRKKNIKIIIIKDKVCIGVGIWGESVQVQRMIFHLWNILIIGIQQRSFADIFI